MERKITKYLIEWKNSSYRKPLILQGARQTGKTYSILAFGRELYDNIAYFNFETTPSLKKSFDESIEPAYLIPLLQREGKVIPVEVKSAENMKAKSLTVYINLYKPAYAVKLSTKNFGFVDSKKTVPLYAAFCL